MPFMCIAENYALYIIKQNICRLNQNVLENAEVECELIISCTVLNKFHNSKLLGKMIILIAPKLIILKMIMIM